jgi:hypothetical protein
MKKMSYNHTLNDDSLNEWDNDIKTAEKWGITPRQVQLLCAKGRISGAVRFGKAWVIPAVAQKLKVGRSDKRCDSR